VAELCVDASASSNEMKYTRCSCSPNAKVSRDAFLSHESLSFEDFELSMQSDPRGNRVSKFFLHPR